MSENKDNLVVIGITGGIGSGKSTISKWIEEKGYPVIISDDLAKELMNSNSELKQKLKNEFGQEIYKEGQLNKKLFAEKLFYSENADKNTKKANQIIHPIVIDEIIKKIEELSEKGSSHIFVESALMFESGMAEGYDYIITVYADQDKVIKRLTESGKLSNNEILKRMDRQLNPIEKKKLSDFVLNNNGSIEELRDSFEKLFDLIIELPPKEFEEG